MSLLLLIIIYCCSVAVFLFTFARSYHRSGFSFHLLFSSGYFVVFYAGFPFSLALNWNEKWYWHSEWQTLRPFIEAILLANLGYGFYWISYHWRNCTKQAVKTAPFFAKNETKLAAWLLAFIALGTLLWFAGMNGLLLFRLEKYSQIFSAQVSGVALKRFFYFFIPALLIFFFLKESKQRWWIFLILGSLFGVISYIVIGGTRANFAMVIALFFLLGLTRRYLALKWLFIASFAIVIAMFVLALIRYRFVLTGEELWHTFLYLTRDTFSPWENLATILKHNVEFQGVMPIIRDFYVYIPQSIWADRPEVVWNTANYFTKIVLGNQSGLAISPTLIGSLYLMGGVFAVMIGMAIIGKILQFFDRLYFAYRNDALIQAYCWGNLFNFIVLVREGSDAFISREVFFSSIFLFCILLAKCITAFIQKGNKNGNR